VLERIGCVGSREQEETSCEKRKVVEKAGGARRKALQGVEEKWRATAVLKEFGAKGPAQRGGNRGMYHHTRQP